MKIPNESIIIELKKGKVSINKGNLGFIDIDENTIAHCDLCGIEIGAQKDIKNEYSPEKITKAIMNGLRPEKILASSIRILQSVMSTAQAEKELYNSWKKMAIGSETPWAVCDECKEQIEKYLNKTEGKNAIP